MSEKLKSEHERRKKQKRKIRRRRERDRKAKQILEKNAFAIVEGKKELFFSVISPAIRDYRYKEIYDSLNHKCQVGFEIIFVGDCPPKEPIAPKFRYIYSSKSAAQCIEIGARVSRGKYLLPIADDLEFSPMFLDGMKYYLTRENLKESLVGCGYTLNGVFYRHLMVFDIKISNTPVLPGTAAYKRDVWMGLGG